MTFAISRKRDAKSLTLTWLTYHIALPRVCCDYASINISVSNEQVILFDSCERRTCELRAGERREPGAGEKLSLSRLRHPPETSKNVGSLLTGEKISLEITKCCRQSFLYLCSLFILINVNIDTMIRRYRRLSLSRVSPFKSKQFKSTQLNSAQIKSNQIKC